MGRGTSYLDARLCDPSAMQTAAGYLQSQWGECGYKIGFAGLWTDSVTKTWHVWQCRHADGSRFLIRSDGYGNCGTFECSLEVEVADLLDVEVV